MKHKLNTRINSGNFWRVIFFISLCFVLYGNTIPNDYSLDDNLIVNLESEEQDGIMDIPRIFVTRYSMSEEEPGQTFGYRPVAKSSFAIEYDLFGQSPHTSHLINILLYALCCILLFFLLRKLLKGYNELFPFIVTLLFLTHPIHTEVVASIRNREEMLSFIGSLVMIHFFIRFAEKWKLIDCVAGILFYLFAYLSKESVISFIAVIPLVIYFFTDVKLKRILVIFVILLITGSIAFFGPLFYLPALDKEMLFFENPLMFDQGFLTRYGTALYSILFYLKLLILPHPLGYYYGYSQIPLVSLYNPMAIVSILIYLFLIGLSILKLRKKNMLSFGILYFLLTLAPVSNILWPINGLVAERLLFNVSLGFCIVIAYLLFRIMKQPPEKEFLPEKTRNRIVMILLIFIVPYSVKTIVRNQDWKDKSTLFAHDIDYLSNSHGAHLLLAEDLFLNASDKLEVANVMFADNSDKNAMSKSLKRNREKLDKAIIHYKRALEIYPQSTYILSNLGGIYFSFFNQNEVALSYFKRALEVDSTSYLPYLSIAYYYDMVNDKEKAARNYEKCLEIDPGNMQCLSKYANLNYRIGDFERAVELNETIMKLFPDSDLPYRNISNYYVMRQDTSTAILYLEKAYEKNNNNRKLAKFLTNYFLSKGESEKAAHYQQK